MDGTDSYKILQSSPFDKGAALESIGIESPSLGWID